MKYTGHIDSFARDNLPPREQWPDLVFDLPELRFPAQVNCGAALLDSVVASGRGERIALRTREGQCTYLQLACQANRIANVLVEDMGLEPGNRVLLPAPNGPMLTASLFAVWKAGGVAVPTMPLLRSRELAQVIRKARVTHALCDRRLAVELEGARATCPTLAQVKYFRDDAPDSLEPVASRKSHHFKNVATAGDDVALIAFTSGTSGIPKGTMHFHRDMLAVCECFPKSMLQHTGDDIVAGTPALAFTYGFSGLFLFPARYGACAVLTEQYTPETLLETVQRFGVTVIYSVPTFYRAMAPIASNYDLSSLRACVSAGEPLPVPTRNAWEQATGVKIIDGIGSSEMSFIYISAAGDDIRPGATGKPIPGYRAAVFDEAGDPAPAGTVGRLAIKGPTGCRYLADERQKSYVHNGWNFTGDAYLVDPDGYYFYQARVDDMIISAGYNIAGPEVESALLAHPAVAECGVVGWPDEERGQIVKAFVVLKLGYQRTDALAAELQDHVKRSIAPYKYPRAVEFMNALPRTETGKLQRFKLRPPQTPLVPIGNAGTEEPRRPQGEPAQTPRSGAR
ncbi:MAG: 2-aminobenzoate-CoA ligase [Betaproteobacteria bacterium RIFCSPLOWO2_02_FULL_65_24]|nr:MAG: 2-aminobenzoate-CoA ligase [Betaproteobacteria bacterium RIFCSPLOWO2_02_FULL_65_24]